MRLEVSAVCDVGLVRSNNEDMLLIGERKLRDGEADLLMEESAGRIVAAVADGLGGAACGEVASEFVISMLSDFVGGLDADSSTDEVMEKMKSWAVLVNRLLRQHGESMGVSGMGTTLTGLLLSDMGSLLFNVGDSRVYRFRDDILRRLSKDHSICELYNNPDLPANIMYNAFSMEGDFFIDVTDISGQVYPGDIFLICSDGLSDLVTDDDIESIIDQNSEMPLPVIKRLLLTAANNAGGKDNISVILVKVLEMK